MCVPLCLIISAITECDLGIYFLVVAQTWWRHQMEIFSALLAICAGNSLVPGELPAQRPVTRRFDVFFDLRLNKLLSKQSRGWWFETLSTPLWRHCNVYSKITVLWPQKPLAFPNPTLLDMHTLLRARLRDIGINPEYFFRNWPCYGRTALNIPRNDINFFSRCIPFHLS